MFCRFDLILWTSIVYLVIQLLAAGVLNIIFLLFSCVYWGNVDNVDNTFDENSKKDNKPMTVKQAFAGNRKMLQHKINTKQKPRLITCNNLHSSSLEIVKDLFLQP